MSPSLQLAGSQYLVITMIILKASCDYDDYFQGAVLQTVIPVVYNPEGCAPGYERFAQYSLTGWSLIKAKKNELTTAIIVVSVVCHFVTSAVAPVLPVVPVVSVVVKKIKSVVVKKRTKEL